MSIYANTFILIYFVVLAVIVGMVLGSFLNCVAMRIVRKESFLKGRSHCPKCGHQLGILDLFPIFSWLFLRGKCRYCASKVSARYPVTETIMALVTVILLLKFDLSFLFLRNWIFTCLLFVLSLVDLESYEIPNLIIIIAIAVWGVGLIGMEHPLEVLKDGGLAALIYGVGIFILVLILDFVLKKESMGGGDVKLIFVGALYLGVVPTLFMLIFACIIGLVCAVAMKKFMNGKVFPFGPALSCAIFAMMIYGPSLAGWYLGML